MSILRSVISPLKISIQQIENFYSIFGGNITQRLKLQRQS